MGHQHLLTYERNGESDGGITIMSDSSITTLASSNLIQHNHSVYNYVDNYMVHYWEFI